MQSLYRAFRHSKVLFRNQARSSKLCQPLALYSKLNRAPGRLRMKERRQSTLKDSGFLTEADPLVAPNKSTNTFPVPEKRKRGTRLLPPKNDDARAKRIKEDRKSTSQKKSKQKPLPNRVKASVNDFTFDTKSKEMPLETPKMVKGATTTEDNRETSDTSNTTIASETSSEPETLSSVSIRNVGSAKKVRPTHKKRSKNLAKNGARSSGNGSELTDFYLSFDPKSCLKLKDGERVPYKLLADTFEKIEGTSKRLEIVRILTEAFRCILQFNSTDLLPAIYLCVNELAAPHEGIKLGVGTDILLKAIANSSGGLNVDRLKQEFNKEGDLGSLAMKKKLKHNLLMQFEPLTISAVFKKFKEIALYSGDKPLEAKRSFIEGLLHAGQGKEPKFIVRSLLVGEEGKLRIGLADQTVLHALGQAFFMELTNNKEKATILHRMEQAVESLKLVYSQCPSYDIIIQGLCTYGIIDLPKRISFTPGIPVQPMLAKPTKGIREVLDKFTGIPFTCEFKYDGERCQVHVVEKGKILLYSRNAENLTPKYPDIVQRVPQYLKSNVMSIVLDCECVAYDRDNNKILPFQLLSTRAKKDVHIDDIKVQVCLFCFDCLYMNGLSLLNKTLTQRREALYNSLETEAGILQFAQEQTSSDVEELQNFLDLAVGQNTEGLVVKTLDCTYEPSKRSINWLKLKKDYMDNVGDSFDLVVIGGWHGKGKRTGVFGSFLLAAYDPFEDEYQTISKIGTGFSEEDLEKFHQELSQIQINKPHPNYKFGETLIPDKWFDAKKVWEVKAADLSISPLHKAAHGMIDASKGISIRFPRLVKIREDKQAKDATTAEQIAEMYKNQQVHRVDDEDSES